VSVVRVLVRRRAREVSRARRHAFALAVTCTLIASACTGDPGSDESNDPRLSSAGQGVSSSKEQAVSADDDQAAVRPLDEALAQALPPPDEQYLRELAERYELVDPPQDVAFERYISPDEYAAAMVPCLTQQGIPARALPDGGVSFGDIPPEQALAQHEAMYRCHVRFPTHPLFAEPLDDDQLRRLYDYLVNDLTACLKDEGYTTAAPPTVETFIASYSHPEADVWSPYPIDDPRLEQPEEWYRLNQICPQSAPLEVLYSGASGSDDR